MAISRKKILAYLKKTRAAPAREIARALKMSSPNVRHHLSVLVSDGRVEFVSVKKRDGRGRPEKMYSLSHAMVGDNLSALANALLDVTGSKLNVEAVASHILDSSQFSNLSVQKRLALLIEKLNEMNYQARWEAGAGGPRIIFGRCPYAKVIDGHDQLCKMDVVILEKVLERPLTRSLKNETKKNLCPFLFQVG